MTQQTLEINLKHHSYQILIERGILGKVPELIAEENNCKRIAVITDSNLENLYGLALANGLRAKGFQTELIVVQPGEQSKSLTVLAEIYEQLSAQRLTREDLIITLGGGVVGDLGGFAASTYLRGVPYIQIPTSLLAQVDSSIGGKVAVDLPSGKNLVGSFYHPKVVYIDPELLRTLDQRFLHDGLAEVVKYGCIREQQIFNLLEACSGDAMLLDTIDGIIYSCCSIKKSVVEKDERDLGERMLLNFGHTIGHAIEKYFNYETYTHGEAVAIGMVAITRNSENMGITEPGTTDRLLRLLSKFSLPTVVQELDMERIMDAVALDKKGGTASLNLILIDRIGESFIRKVPTKELQKYINF